MPDPWDAKSCVILSNESYGLVLICPLKAGQEGGEVKVDDNPIDDGVWTAGNQSFTVERVKKDDATEAPPKDYLDEETIELFEWDSLLRIELVEKSESCADTNSPA